MYDVIVVGAGFAGSIIARRLAEEKNKRVLLIEKREHIGGNMYDYYNSFGILVHKYGPHIFHTSYLEVFNYLSRFSKWSPYKHKVVVCIDKKYVPLPINFNSIDILFDKNKGDRLKNKLRNCFNNTERVSIFDLLNNEDKELIELGEYIYHRVYKNYTKKQWGKYYKYIEKEVLMRVPIALSNSDYYFYDNIQAMPEYGYAFLFKNILSHKNIELRLNCDGDKRISLKENRVYFDNELLNIPLVYTGSIDGLLNYKYGHLAYRSSNMVFENYNTTYFMPYSVINYPNDNEFTRITEFKHMTKQMVENKTCIMKEYPIDYDISYNNRIPYYPVLTPNNKKLYEKYKNEIESYKNIFLCGRLAEYKYYNMDMAIKSAFDNTFKIIKYYNW